ncbi:hypothetical protein [Actinoplanes xinjiangensis]|uniref:hypothetical protein n=1 Tax=Actinoplanes xinjiangensis TaxID=512350 RepID=UPI00342034E3
MAVLLGAIASALVGRFHQDHGHEKRAAGVFVGIALWPLIVILAVLSRFFIMVAGWGMHGV